MRTLVLSILLVTACGAENWPTAGAYEVEWDHASGPEIGSRVLDATTVQVERDSGGTLLDFSVESCSRSFAYCVRPERCEGFDLSECAPTGPGTVYVPEPEACCAPPPDEGTAEHLLCRAVQCGGQGDAFTVISDGDGLRGVLRFGEESFYELLARPMYEP